MASPFSIFRRHQRVMIAALTLLAMFAFVFLDPLLEHLGGGGGRNPAVITTDNFGDLNENDIDNLRRQRQLVLSVMERALVGGGIHPTLAGYQIMQIFGPPEEEAVVQAWLLAKRAEDLGMVVDERAIRDFLRLFLEQLTENRVGLSEIAAILKEDGIPQRIFFSALQKELLSRQFQQSFQASLRAVPPMQRWDYYRRLNQRANIELTPVSVVKYMAQIEDPGDEVLRPFFEEHKETEWHRDLPDPAFREPEKVALQYFQANLNDFVRPEAIPGEEVQEYYEENKETLFSMPQTPAAEEPATPEASEPSEKPGDAEVPAQEAEAEQPDDAQASEAEEMEATEPLALPTEEDAEPDEESENTESDQPEEPAEEPADAPVDAPAAQEEPKADADGAALKHQHSGVRFRLASYQEEAEETAAERGEPAGETAPSDAQETPMSEASDATEPEDAAAEPEDAEPESDDSEAPAPEADDTKPAPETGPAAPEPSTIDGRPTAAPRYRPLAEVEGQIRETLARRKARESVEERLQSLSSQIRNYHDELTRYEVHKDDDATVKKPAELDLANLAKENGLKFVETPLITAWEASGLDIGNSLVGGATPFVLAAFEKLPPFQPTISQSDEDYFLFWITQKEEGRVPEWNEEGMRKKVLEAWKLVEARSLARTAAEELAKKVRESGKTLEEFFEGDEKQEVIHAGPFTWMTFGDIPPSLAREPPRVSEVEGVASAGPQFMHNVFSLAEGEVGTAMNQPETFCYVIRMESLAPPRNILWEGFLVDDFQSYFPVSIPDLRQMQSTWMKGIEEAAGLEWKREPQRSRDND